jgi:hypothetical protein
MKIYIELTVASCLMIPSSWAFLEVKLSSPPISPPFKTKGYLSLIPQQHESARRGFMLQTVLFAPFAALLGPSTSLADFTPGGTLVDYAIGVQVGNPQASASRKADNSNVLFHQDYYLKFGTAPAFINDDSFPKTTPFVPSQQRYDALKKYKDRIQRGVELMTSIADQLDKMDGSGGSISILDSDAPEYSIRPMGLLANALLASENTGTTNELMLARWYINELVLDLSDVQRAAAGGRKDEANERYKVLIQALRSYLQLMNRQINAKVGNKFALPAAS